METNCFVNARAQYPVFCIAIILFESIRGFCFHRVIHGLHRVIRGLHQMKPGLHRVIRGLHQGWGQLLNICPRIHLYIGLSQVGAVYLFFKCRFVL